VKLISPLDLQFQILKLISPAGPGPEPGPSCTGKVTVASLFGKDFVRKIQGKIVLDYGCGDGLHAVEMAQYGAKQVIGLDIREELLERARGNAVSAHVQDKCVFCVETGSVVDIVVSVDAFEHFDDPELVLKTMNNCLHPCGEAFISFGPTWYHPLGGHLFSVFPWAHLLFSEPALIRWRSTFKSDGASTFREVSGGLNQMTILKFENLLSKSRYFSLAHLELVPIKKLRAFHSQITREFTTSAVRCRLVKRDAKM
jgi:SAM-dependent methyltransferase